MDGPERFRIGPLQGALKGATVVLIALPFIVAGLGLAGGQRAVGLGTAGLLVLCYGIVWLAFWPKAFRWAPDALFIEFPLRGRRIPRADVGRLQLLDRAELQERLGFVLRFGVGGLFGTFGLLWTSRTGFVDVYLTRSDDVVWIHRREGRPILCTPASPRAFVEAGQPP